jgi:hypothetical protein
MSDLRLVPVFCLALLGLAAGPAPAQACIGENGIGCGVLDSCCSGLSCIAGVCVDTSSCQSSGQFCSSSSQCCSGLSCAGGICGSACQDEGELCLSDSQCCGDRICHLGTCRSERQAGELCGPLAPCEDPLVCDIDGLELRCRHDPPIVGEACSVIVPCADDLACNILLTCVEPRGVGDACGPAAPCRDGLVCSPCAQDDTGSDFGVVGCDAGLMCFPALAISAPSEAACLEWYSPARHAEVMAGIPAQVKELFGLRDGAVTYGKGAQVVGGEAKTVEFGAAYGRDGRYGCYKTECSGFELDLAVEAFDCVGNYDGYGNVSGRSTILVGEVGSLGLNVSKVAVFPEETIPLPGSDVGVAACVSGALGFSPIPASAGGYDCNTQLVSVIGNGPPTARCADAEVCADATLCTATASIDAGSSDPDGDAITLDQSPAGPYSIGVHALTLTAEDPFGEAASCMADLAVSDCTAPAIACPPATTVECASDGQSIVDPGDAAVTDCSIFTVDDPGAASYPLGATSVTYTATDLAGNQSSCQTSVTVVDTTAPSIDSAEAAPSSLWPPNHSLQTIELSVSATDACDPSLTCAVVAITSSEADAGLDPEDLPGDTQIVDADTVRLRAERSDSGPGRSYGIEVECRDGSGNVSQVTVGVFVPHDMRPGA